MAIFRRAAAAALLVLAAPAASRAIPAGDLPVVDAGLDALYRGDDLGAIAIFDDAHRRAPDDPVLSLGSATARWWRLENDFAPVGGDEEKDFLAADRRAIDDALRATRGADRADAYLCLGAAYGLRGRLSASRQRWLAAYLDGRRSYMAETRAVALDPNEYDAYLGLGAFDYYAATLSRLLRLFAFTAGSKQRGLAELELAKNGRFSGVAARLLLVGIDWTFEKKPQEAWRILEKLSARYPDSPTMRTMRMIGLFHLRDAEGLQREARDFLRLAEGGAPFYRPLDRAAGHYFLGLGEELAGRYEDALTEERAALALIPPGHRTRGVPMLFIGECEDLLGRRADATASYRAALKEAPFWGVPRYARYLIKHPFRAGANPLPGRNDELD